MPANEKRLRWFFQAGCAGRAHMACSTCWKPKASDSTSSPASRPARLSVRFPPAADEAVRWSVFSRAVDFFSLAFQMTNRFRVARRGADKLDALLTEFFGDKCFEISKLPLVNRRDRFPER